MKKIIISLTFLLTIFACKTEKQKDYLVLSGTIQHFDKEHLDLKTLDGTLVKSIPVTDNGTFSDTLQIESGYYSLSIDKQKIELYLNKAEDLQLNYNQKDTVVPLAFNGKLENENKYLYEKDKVLKNSYGGNDELYALNEQTFLNKIDSVESHLKALAKNSKLAPSFLSQELKNLQYKTATYLSNYERFYRYFANNKTFKVSDDFPKDIFPSDLNNIDDFNSSLDYRTLVQTFYHKKVSEHPDVNDDIYNVVYMDLVNEGITNQFIKNQLLYDNAKYGITFTTETETFYKTFMASSTNEVHKKEVTKTYNTLQKTAKGKTSPKFVDYKNYNGGTTSLDDLKGQYVYIDVWATWCGPCKKEIPYLKELEEEYRGKNIAFVSISIDKVKDTGKWKKMVADKEMKGVQLIADSDWKSSFVKDYNIMGIPRFILIDTEGKIISASAPRPSNPKLIEIFNQLGV